MYAAWSKNCFASYSLLSPTEQQTSRKHTGASNTLNWLQSTSKARLDQLELLHTLTQLNPQQSIYEGAWLIGGRVGFSTMV